MLMEMSPYVNKSQRLYEEIKSIWRQGSMQRHPQILGDTQDISMIKTVKKQSHGTSDFRVLKKTSNLTTQRRKVKE
jgi:hypothetical protein